MPCIRRAWPACMRCTEPTVAYFRYTDHNCKAIETLCEFCSAEARLGDEPFGGRSTDWEPTKLWKAPYFPWRPDTDVEANESGLVAKMRKRDQWIRSGNYKEE